MSVYATVGALDSVKSNGFYDATLATIGWSKHREFPGWSAYSEGGKGDGFVLWVCEPFNGNRRAPEMARWSHSWPSPAPRWMRFTMLP